MPHTGLGLASAKRLAPVLRRCYFMAGFCDYLPKVPARTAFSRTRSQTAQSKLRSPRPMYLCARGSSEDIMSSSARRSWKKRAFSAIIHCSAQDYGTSSTTNDDGDHCEKQEWDFQNITTYSGKYSSVGSKIDNVEPSVMVLGAGSVLFLEHWDPDARDESGPTSPGLVAPSLIGEKWPEVLLLRPR